MPNLPTSETFIASRWTKGNFFFPIRIVVTPLHVSRVKPRLFGSNEESIAIAQVASVQISTGVIWSNIRIESSGGTDPDHQPRPSQGRRAANSRPDRELSGGEPNEQVTRVQISAALRR